MSVVVPVEPNAGHRTPAVMTLTSAAPAAPASLQPVFQCRPGPFRQ